MPFGFDYIHLTRQLVHKYSLAMRMDSNLLIPVAHTLGTQPKDRKAGLIRASFHGGSQSYSPHLFCPLRREDVPQMGLGQCRLVLRKWGAFKKS